MALTNADCRDGKTNGGSAVKTYDIFDGEGYCHVVNKTIGGIDFRLYGRAHSYSSSADTCTITMYLFARKSDSTKDSYNNDKYSQIEFTCAGKVVDFKATAKGMRVEKTSGSVRCLGSADVKNVSCASGAKGFKAIWYGIDGTDYASGTYTISETMYWNKANADGDYPSISISNKTTTSWTAKISKLRPGRNCYTTWVWNRKNNTSGADWTDGAAYTVAHDSDSTTHEQDYSGGSAGNNYTVKFTCYLRNYNPLKSTSTRKFELWNTTTTVTTNKNSTTISASPTSVSLKVNETATTTLSTNASGGSYTTSMDNESIATRSRSGSTVTFTGQSAGTTYLNATYSGATGYADKTVDNLVKVTVSRATGNTTISPTSLTFKYGDAAKTATATVSYKGAAPTISSAPNSSVATASISGSTVTVTPKGAGTTSLKVNSAQTGKYTADDATLSITVAQGQGTLTLDGTAGNISKTFTYGDANSTVTVAGEGGPVSVSSNNTSVCTASISGNTITLNPEHAGTATVTVTRAANTNYTAISRTISVTVNKAPGFATWTAANQSLKETQTYTAKVSNVHYNGVLKLKSNSDSSVASCTISGANANIVANKLGSTTITLYVDSSADYTASPDKSFTITVRPAEVKLGTKTTPVYLGSKPVRRVYVGDKIVIF